jgi:Amidase
MTTYMHYATLLEAASALRSRKVSTVELTRALLDRIAKIDPSLHSYATVTPELALKQAEASDAEIAAGDYRGQLHGVPIAVKDITVLHRVATADGRFTRSQIETAIRFLLDRGADPAIRDEVYHSTPIGWAYHFRQSDRVDLLIDRAGIMTGVGCDRADRLRAAGARSKPGERKR